jgi:hypothetical protein
VRSASFAPIALLGATGLLAGCTTTMQQAARLQLNSARIRAGELSTRVHVAGRAVRIDSVGLVSAGGATAVVVRVRNGSDRQIGDLPISVGVRSAGRPPLYLNAQSGRFDFYFDAHLPVVAQRTTLTWVYTLHRRVPAGAAPFAIVGRRPDPPVSGSGELPVIRAASLRSRVDGRGGAGPAGLRVAVHNLSEVPQYQLQLYAFARRGDRYVAAGRLTVDELDAGASKTYRLDLIGRPGRGRVNVEAVATTLQ